MTARSILLGIFSLAFICNVSSFIVQYIYLPSDISKEQAARMGFCLFMAAFAFSFWLDIYRNKKWPSKED